jgi:hypothetical protein
MKADKSDGMTDSKRVEKLVQMLVVESAEKLVVQ